MNERGVVLARFGGVPTWRLVVLGVLALAIGEPVARGWYLHHELAPPAWLMTQFGVLVVLATVLMVVGLVFDVVRHALSDEPHVAALYARGLVIKRRLQQRFVPYTAVRGFRERVIETTQTTATGATTKGQSYVFWEIDCGDAGLAMVRESEGGADTVNLIMHHAELHRPAG